jgi:hypothetical protein
MARLDEVVVFPTPPWRRKKTSRVTHGAGQESDSVWFRLRFRVGVGRGARCVLANADLSREVGAGGQALERTFPPTKMNLNADSTSGTQVPLVVIWPPVCFEDSSKLREGTSCVGLTPRKLMRAGTF